MAWSDEARAESARVRKLKALMHKRLTVGRKRKAAVAPKPKFRVKLNESIPMGDWYGKNMDDGAMSWEGDWNEVLPLTGAQFVAKTHWNPVTDKDKTWGYDIQEAAKGLVMQRRVAIRESEGSFAGDFRAKMRIMRTNEKSFRGPAGTYDIEVINTDPFFADVEKRWEDWQQTAYWWGAKENVPPYLKDMVDEFDDLYARSKAPVRKRKKKAV
jgi:hypothetical protein